MRGDLDIAIPDGNRHFHFKGNRQSPKFNRQSPLVGGLHQSWPQGSVDLNGGAKNSASEGVRFWLDCRCRPQHHLLLFLLVDLRVFVSSW